MNMSKALFKPGFFLVIALVTYNHAFATPSFPDDKTDVVRIASSKSKIDIRTKYTNDILEKALSLSVEKYGAYRIDKRPISMTNDVTFYELHHGSIINVAMSGATPDKDHLAIPIRIPIRRGILNYRLLVINKEKQDEFKKINSVEQLKEFSAGIHAKAVTSEIMNVMGFPIIEGASYDGMFKQLSKGLFDYIPRGIHEAYDELLIRENEIDNLIIEPHLAIYMPMPYYIYVSPAFPRLAERLTFGLEKMIEKGLIKSTFDQYYAEDIKRAKLSERTIIVIGNPFLSPKTPFNRKELWMDEFAIKKQAVLSQ